ncbi:MAG: ketose-bisphosphate aldolase [Armatimonadetes bacterium]|nr:ketose-bisphosphate aldolase [Armatimonadota bacterium]
MPLMTTKPMFDLAYGGGFAIGAFNVNNMEIIQGIVDAAKEERAPLILQISKGARQYANIKYLRGLINVAVEDSGDLPIAIHLDHGDTVALCKECVDDGFTSIMVDASHNPFDENIRITKEVVDYCHPRGVTVEAELGQLGGIEEHVVGVDDVMKHLTDPTQVAEFWKRTGCDSLAVAIGTSHGAYKFKSEPKLALERVEEIMKTAPGFPLVMHGSSSVPRELTDEINRYGGKMPNTMGVPESAIGRAARLGVCKVNIDTDLRLALTAKIRKVFTESPGEFDPRKYLGPGRDAIRELVRHKLHVLGVAGKAAAVIARWKELGSPVPAYYQK